MNTLQDQLRHCQHWGQLYNHSPPAPGQASGLLTQVLEIPDFLERRDFARSLDSHPHGGDSISLLTFTEGVWVHHSQDYSCAHLQAMVPSAPGDVQPQHNLHHWWAGGVLGVGGLFSPFNAFENQGWNPLLSPFIEIG